MSSFVETEAERRSQNLSLGLLPAKISFQDSQISIFLMNLRPNGCKAVAGVPNLAKTVRLSISLPGGDNLEVGAEAKMAKKLSQNRYQYTLSQFEFSDDSEQRRLLAYVNEVESESSALGAQALKLLDDEEVRRLSRLVEASRLLNPCLDYLQTLEQVVDVARRALGAERGLFLVDRGGDDVVLEVARGTGIEKRGLGFSTTVTRQVMESRAPLLSLDAQTDTKLGGVQSLQMLGTVSVVCVPLISSSCCFGLLYMDNSVQRGIFRDTDLSMATILADLATTALEKNRHHQYAVQSQAVRSTKNVVSSLTGELLPSLKSLQTLSKGSSPEVISQVEKCVSLVESIVPLGRFSRRGRTRTELMDVFEEIALDFQENVTFPLPPIEGWPKLLLDLCDLTVIISEALVAAGAGENKPVTLAISSQADFLRISICSPQLELSSHDYRKVFLPFGGLGLSEAQRLVHKNRGLLRLHPNLEGGQVFTVELPLAEPLAPSHKPE